MLYNAVFVYPKRLRIETAQSPHLAYQKHLGPRAALE